MKKRILFLFFLIYLSPLSNIAAGKTSVTDLVPVSPANAIEQYIQPVITAPEKLASMELKNVDISDVLALFSQEYKLDIVAGKEVTGNVTISLSSFPVEEALRAILAVNGFAYRKFGNLIMVSTPLNLSSRNNPLIEDALVTKVFTLNYMSAEEIKKIADKYLSSAGAADVVKNFYIGGWEMGGISGSVSGGVSGGGGGGVSGGEGGARGSTIGEKARKKSALEEKPRILIITDFAKVVDRIETIIKQLDVKPSQILIDAMIVEIGSKYVRDIGIDWNVAKTNNIAYDFATLAAPAEGLSLAYEKSPATIKIMALEQEGKADILSNPRIMTLNNYPAIIMVGERYPIMTTTLTSDITGTGKVIATGALDHYEPIGIILRVIPRIDSEGMVELILHPEITSIGENVSSGGGAGALILPRINSRETDTDITVKDGQTAVIGGLLTREMKNTIRKVPFLGDIPILGYLFKRTIKESEKKELIIFITPHVINEPANAEKLLQEKAAQVK